MDYLGIATLIASITGLIGGVAAAVTSVITALRVQKVGQAVNGRLTELLALTKSSGRAEGRLAEAARHEPRDPTPPGGPFPPDPAAPQQGGPP